MSNRFYFIVLALILLAISPVQAQERTVPETAAQVQLSFSPLVKKTAPAVVNIYTKRTVSKFVRSPMASDPFFAPFFRNDVFGGQMRDQVENSLGSGVIVAPDGLVVTNYHVAGKADEIMVVLSDGREFAARLALADQASDLALLRIDTKGEVFPFVNLKPSESLEVGDLVLAIGNPFGVGQTVTSGIVSAKGRSSLNISDFNFFIQTDAAINPGNSGGPLVALDGGVVGINSAIFSKDGGSLGIGFSIPSEMVAFVIAAEKAGATGQTGIVRPWMGVSVQNVTSDIAASLGLKKPQGALIGALHSASPLKKAGIKVGDLVSSINGHKLQDASEMKFRMATVAIGQTAKVEIVRLGQSQIFDVQAIAPPDAPPRDVVKIGGQNLFSGASVVNMNPAVAHELDLPEQEGAVVVLDVERASPAARLLVRGDVLLEINSIKIKTSRDVEKALKAGDGLSLYLVKNSGGRVQKIVIR
jgi:Do/DeqQ family serine protease